MDPGKTVPVRTSDYSRLRTAKLPRYSLKIDSFGTVQWTRKCVLLLGCASVFFARELDNINIVLKGLPTLKIILSNT
jgi:hypothetical protein